MKVTQLKRARDLIVCGYFVIFVGAAINFAWQVSNGFVLQNWRGDVALFSVPFASMSALGAWWFLSQIAPDSPPQQVLLWKAYLGLMLQAIFLAATYSIIVFSNLSPSWTNAAFWGYGVGTVITAIGYFLMVLTYRSGFVPSEELATTDR